MAFLIYCSIVNKNNSAEGPPWHFVYPRQQCSLYAHYGSPQHKLMPKCRRNLAFQSKDSLVSAASQVITAHSHLYGFFAKRFFFSDFWLFSPKGCMKKKN